MINEALKRNKSFHKEMKNTKCFNDDINTDKYFRWILKSNFFYMQIIVFTLFNKGYNYTRDLAEKILNYLKNTIFEFNI